MATQGLAACMGLAPFLRRNLAAEDIRPWAERLLQLSREQPHDAGIWRDLAIAMYCLGQDELADGFLTQALQVGRHYCLLRDRPDTSLRVLMLLAEGNLSANTPLECLLENTDIELLQTILPVDMTEEGLSESLQLPEHDVLFVAVAESPVNKPLLESLTALLANWPRPVVNRPDHLLGLARDAVATTLQDVGGMQVPQVSRLSRKAILQGTLVFPCILRPEDSQAGRGLQKIDEVSALHAYLQERPEDSFYYAPFIDYSNGAGEYIKMRLAVVDGVAWPCHQAISSHWMVHYVNAGMYEDACKRQREATFMREFQEFRERHGATLAEVARRLGLSYVLLDLAELPDGRLLLFEADAAMVVHAMDPEHLFPYKQTAMLELRNAVVASLRKHAGVAY